ncbi:helix-turn-helix domain-containing protein [Novosphingobium sp. JCM 18896]|uniref:helix-turn-helix domain-containing protein n=1 Tax=Novosphingobium sp. JCM 18896 TaxID=2989731 RepID=UPI0022224B6D|nr:helix-turn-helix domain-containing protein [Novosphingobium sp. JCM 18896]MCW1432058.1 helix-turn-helix domain-containing protein [Novosphingobium sp. JCM 18896]
MDAAELLGVSEAAVDELRESGRLLGVSCGTEIRFPADQFAGRTVLPGLEPVLAAFGEIAP